MSAKLSLCQLSTLLPHRYFQVLGQFWVLIMQPTWVQVCKISRICSLSWVSALCPLKSSNRLEEILAMVYGLLSLLKIGSKCSVIRTLIEEVQAGFHPGSTLIVQATIVSLSNATAQAMEVTTNLRSTKATSLTITTLYGNGMHLKNMTRSQKGARHLKLTWLLSTPSSSTTRASRWNTMMNLGSIRVSSRKAFGTQLTPICHRLTKQREFSNSQPRGSTPMLTWV